MIAVDSYSDFNKKTKGLEKYWLLLYKETSENSDCAYKGIEESLNSGKEKIAVFTADVNNVRDIHTKYEINSVPTLLRFDNQEFIGVYKGCNNASFYKSLFSDTMFSASGNGNEIRQKSVTVYSTPTCSWCTRIKNYFKENNIKFRDIDVSKDQKAAEAMVKRSGQQGVPQTLIGGQIIIGFDKAKIDKLLGL